MSFNAPARYFDGKTSAAQNVTVIIDDRDVILCKDGNLGDAFATLSRRDLLLCEKPHANSPLRLRRLRDDGMRIVFSKEDAKTVGDILRQGPVPVAVDEASGRAITRLTVGIIGFTALVGLVIWLAVPIAAQIFADLYPKQSEIAMGKSARDQILYTLGKLDDDFEVCEPTDQAYDAVDKIITQLGTNTPLGYDYEVTFVRSDIPNALALPGGQILVFSALTDIMDSPEAFTGVLAHEIGHSEMRHGLRNLFANSAITQLIRLISGGAMIFPAELALKQGYTRGMEREADAFALDSMQRANIRTTDTAILFAKLRDMMEKDHGGLDLPEMLSSHPDMNARITLFENATATGAVQINAAEWQSLKTVCDDESDG